MNKLLSIRTADTVIQVSNHSDIVVKLNKLADGRDWEIYSRLGFEPENVVVMASISSPKENPLPEKMLGGYIYFCATTQAVADQIYQDYLSK